MVVNAKGRMKMNINSISNNNQQNFGKLYIKNVNQFKDGVNHLRFISRMTQIDSINEALPKLQELAKNYDIFIKGGIKYDAEVGTVCDAVLNFKATKLNDFFGRFIKSKHGKSQILWETNGAKVVEKAQEAIANLENKI